jgi:hypothetical protein
MPGIVVGVGVKVEYGAFNIERLGDRGVNTIICIDLNILVELPESMSGDMFTLL